jgi:hypothetical protein
MDWSHPRIRHVSRSEDLVLSTLESAADMQLERAEKRAGMMEMGLGVY